MPFVYARNRDHLQLPYLFQFKEKDPKHFGVVSIALSDVNPPKGEGYDWVPEELPASGVNLEAPDWWCEGVADTIKKFNDYHSVQLCTEDPWGKPHKTRSAPEHGGGNE